MVCSNGFLNHLKMAGIYLGLGGYRCNLIKMSSGRLI